MSISKKVSELSPHELENLRDQLSTSNNLSKFKDLYLEGLQEIKNKNTSTLWSKKFVKNGKIDEQDLMTQEKISFIANFITNMKQGIKLLDIGIGEAFLEQELEKRRFTFELSAIDISRLCIERAQKKYKAVAFTGDALDVGKLFKQQSFDVIVAIEVLEHISPHKIFSLYKQIYQLLTDDGLFIISTPTNEDLEHMKDNPNAHVREYTIPILKAEFELSQFEVIETKTLIAFKSLYQFKKLVSKILPNRWKPNNIIIVARKS